MICAGWAGPIVVAAASIAATFALLALSSAAKFPQPMPSSLRWRRYLLSGIISWRVPHVLVLPVMLAWAYGLMSASERGEAPSFWLLPLIALWANLHGGFVFGLVLVGAFALDALWNADHSQQKPPRCAG